LGAGAEYLAFVFTIVYVGAVSILFLFVIMLINIRNVAAPYSLLPAARKLLMVVTLGLTALLVIRFSQTLDAFLFTSDCLQFVIEPTTAETLINYVTTQFLDILVFSERLYTDFSYLFFLIALLLLTAMLGAIILATGATDSNETVI
jgi:NADH:ubiquinone oxidoreductase subunit 6 (subunit J)